MKPHVVFVGPNGFALEMESLDGLGKMKDYNFECGKCGRGFYTETSYYDHYDHCNRRGR